jgi:hypothetical protein
MPLFPSRLFRVEADLDGDGIADGVFVSTEELRDFAEWKAEVEKAFADNIAIGE